MSTDLGPYYPSLIYFLVKKKKKNPDCHLKLRASTKRQVSQKGKKAFSCTMMPCYYFILFMIIKINTQKYFNNLK
jgi:hypothetical protein